MVLMPKLSLTHVQLSFSGSKARQHQGQLQALHTDYTWHLQQATTAIEAGAYTSTEASKRWSLQK